MAGRADACGVRVVFLELCMSVLAVLWCCLLLTVLRGTACVCQGFPCAAVVVVWCCVVASASDWQCAEGMRG